MGTNSIRVAAIIVTLLSARTGQGADLSPFERAWRDYLTIPARTSASERCTVATKAHAVAVQTYGIASLAALMTCEWQAKALETCGETEQALLLMAQAREAAASGTTAQRENELASLQGHYVTVLLSLGRTKQAEAAARSCIALVRKSSNPSTEGLVAGLNALSRCYAAAGSLRKAYRVLRRAWQLLRPQGDQHRALQVATLRQLAALYYRAGRLERAKNVLQRVAALEGNCRQS